MLYPYDLLHLEQKRQQDNSKRIHQTSPEARLQCNKKSLAYSALSQSPAPNSQCANTKTKGKDKATGKSSNTELLAGASSQRCATKDESNRKCIHCQKQILEPPTQLRRVPMYGDLSIDSEQSHWLMVEPCPFCDSIQRIEVCGYLWTPTECLKSTDFKITGLKQVDSHRDRFIIFGLSQVMFQQEESSQDQSKVTFLCPGPTEFGKILWVDGVAAGFYTLKLKGSSYTGCNYLTYQMPVVDLVYIRPEFRRRGLATTLVQDMMRDYPDEDVGFSEPVSEAMLQVLGKYLEVYAERRDQLWEVSWTGQEGFRNNIWLLIHRLRRERKSRTDVL